MRKSAKNKRKSGKRCLSDERISEIASLRGRPIVRAASMQSADLSSALWRAPFLARFLWAREESEKAAVGRLTPPF